MQCKSIKRSYKCVYTAKQKLSLPSSRCSKLDAQTCRRFLVAMSVTVHGSVCSFCVRLCGWTRSLCLSALPSDRAPDEVIRTVTGVARLHCLYLAGVSVVRCQIVFTLVVFLLSVSVFQVLRLFSPGRVSVFP